MANQIIGTESTMPLAATRTANQMLTISFPSTVALPKGTPVKLDSAGNIVAAENAPHIGIVYVPIANDKRNEMMVGHCTVLVHASGETECLTPSAVAAGAELKYIGLDTASGLGKYATAAAGDSVCAFARSASAAGGTNKAYVLFASYKKA